ncbi:alginate O-acetyltransferase complex protein AlgI [Tissierella praeacuta DSM 18095]|uniref:Alginate O-acetyltransferase complex protein AlgI n=1 Tax=Tissierella praeacuta DSM 18095 TaxID=1123404 RepID=A0A1M4VJP7_9FIRM|nr:MBOAT family O-acyltransferase [Tissierella praeacuta]SHE69093.1 alginate O-acetyltransferase complex protein AlgI [Tissierella praeacuta DSM 18095]SUO99111.1 D-alanyl-lipoteichoic acid biosynthesis protein DltB [Tissierella praeacuta]
MVFSSILFLFYFLPVVLTIYFISPKKYRNFILFLSSLLFYSWGEPKYIWIMLFSTILDYTCGRLVYRYKDNKDVNKARLWLGVSIFTNLGLLGFFKYSDFFISNINNIFGFNISLLNLTLPIGISFYTFQTMSYTIDVYRGDTKVQNNIISFGTYVTLFPQLIAGPIVRYQTVAEEINNRIESYDLFSEGIKRFILGLGKKVLLANNIGLLWKNISSLNTWDISVLTAWLGILGFSFQIYFDFSGYSDMAIGLGKIFGFNFLENFNYPYMSKSITEFWRRWHISLGTWFREYLYIPLGGNRKGRVKHIRNILIVWILTGIWHGASWNFALWGLFFGVTLIIEKLFLLNLLEKLPHYLTRIYTLSLVLMSWVIFAFDSIKDGLNYIKILFGFGNNPIFNHTSLYLLYTNILLFLILIIGSTDIPKRLWKYMSNRFNNKSWIIENIFLLLVLGLSIAYLVDQSYNPFLYFRF